MRTFAAKYLHSIPCGAGSHKVLIPRYSTTKVPTLISHLNLVKLTSQRPPGRLVLLLLLILPLQQKQRHTGQPTVSLLLCAHDAAQLLCGGAFARKFVALHITCTVVAVLLKLAPGGGDGAGRDGGALVPFAASPLVPP